MTNPLDEHMENFRIAVDAFKVVRRVLDGRENPVSTTDFHGLTSEEGHQMLDGAEKLLGKLVAFALFTVFERTLRDHLSSSLNPIAESVTTPMQLATKLHDFLEAGVDDWPVSSVIELFCPPVDQGDVGNAKNIRTYRHHVAHGAVPPAVIPPQTAYVQLSEFLRNAGVTT